MQQIGVHIVVQSGRDLAYWRHKRHQNLEQKTNFWRNLDGQAASVEVNEWTMFWVGTLLQTQPGIHWTVPMKWQWHRIYVVLMINRRSTDDYLFILILITQDNFAPMGLLRESTSRQRLITTALNCTDSDHIDDRLIICLLTWISNCHYFNSLLQKIVAHGIHFGQWEIVWLK